MADQSFTITSTFTPPNGPITCSLGSLTVNKGNKGLVTVNLQLSAGGTGSIKIQSSPVTWSPAPPASFNVVRKSDTQILITAPNGTPPAKSESYHFQVNYTYTPPGGTPKNGTGDPTIVLEGTGASHHGHHGKS